MYRNTKSTKSATLDFVITWVDGNDPAWRKEKSEYSRLLGQSTTVDDCEERYRDWNNLQYWFRGIEKFAPWVHKIHFVTWGHLPSWLNPYHPKLQIVRHTDYIPQQYLPTFNSHTIEWNLHRIKGISRRFVYFNDDMFLLKPLHPDDFFIGDKPKDMLALQPDVANVDNEVMPYIYLNNAMLLAKYFDKRENMKKQPGAYFHIGYPAMYFCYNLIELAFPRFTGFYTVHGPSPLKTDTFKTLWELEPELLDKVCSHTFRHKEDVNQYILREYEKLKGNFIPSNVKKLCGYYNISDDNQTLIQAITGQHSKILCLNDSNHKIDFEKAKSEIHHAFEQIFPEKSSFEL